MNFWDTVSQFYSDHPKLVSLMPFVFTMGGIAIGYVLKAYRYRRQLRDARQNNFSGHVVMKTAVLRLNSATGRQHLSIRSIDRLDEMYAVFANRPIVDVIINTAAEIIGLVRIPDAVLQRIVIDFAKLHATGNDIPAAIAFLTGQHVRQDRIVVGVMSHRHTDVEHPTEIHRIGMTTILVLHKPAIEIMRLPDFCETVELGLSATKRDAELVHNVALIADEELAKKPGRAALGEADIESIDWDRLVNRTADEVVSRLIREQLAVAA